jgi:ribosomal protein S14
MTQLSSEQTSEFDRYYNGLLYSVMRWDQLTEFWQKVDAGAGWYLYAVGQQRPQAPSDAEKVKQFMREVDELLRREHHEDYCAIVYADDLDAPSFIKIYDPGHLGSSCGSSSMKSSVAPGWLMCRMPPRELEMSGVVTGQRKRWWQAFLGEVV